MTTTFALTSALEILAVVLLLVGFIHEKKLIAFEDRAARIIGRTILYFIRRRKAKKLAQARPVPVQRPVPASVVYPPEPVLVAQQPAERKVSDHVA